MLQQRCFRGSLRLRFSQGHGGRTHLSEAFRSGPFHFSKPYWDGRQLLVQLVNPTAGLFSGDQLHSSVCVEPNSRACLTAPSSSQVYAMAGGEPARWQQSVLVEAGAALACLPRWTVLHRGARLEQSTTLSVDSSGMLVFPEMIAAGRVGSGEALQFDYFRSSLELKVDGQLVLKEKWTSGRELNTWIWSAQGRFCPYLLSVLVVGKEAHTLSRHACPTGCFPGIVSFGLSLLAENCALLRCLGDSSVALYRFFHAFARGLGSSAPVSPVWERVS